MWWPLVTKQRLSKILHLVNDRFHIFSPTRMFFFGPGISSSHVGWYFRPSLLSGCRPQRQLLSTCLNLPQELELSFLKWWAASMAIWPTERLAAWAGLSDDERRVTVKLSFVMLWGGIPFGKQWTTIMSCVLGNPFEMDMFQIVSVLEGNQWIIVIKNAETNQQTLANLNQ